MLFLYGFLIGVLSCACVAVWFYRRAIRKRIDEEKVRLTAEAEKIRKELGRKIGGG
jgi:hypothetical protein